MEQQCTTTRSDRYELDTHFLSLSETLVLRVLVRMRKLRRNDQDAKNGTVKRVGPATGERFILRPSLRPSRKEQAPRDQESSNAASYSCRWEVLLSYFRGARRKKEGETRNFLDDFSTVFVQRRRSKKEDKSMTLKIPKGEDGASFHQGGFRGRALFLFDSMLLLSRDEYFSIIVILLLVIIALVLIQKILFPISKAYTNYRASLFAPFGFISEAFLQIFPNSAIPSFIHKHSLMLDEFARNFLPSLISHLIPTLR